MTELLVAFHNFVSMPKNTLVNIAGPWLGSRQDICLMEDTCYSIEKYTEIVIKA